MDGFGIEKSFVDKGQGIVGGYQVLQIEGIGKLLRGH